MPKKTDWMPASRILQVAMATLWHSLLTSDVKDAEGKTVKLWVFLGIPAAILEAFLTALSDARNTLNAAINTVARVDVSNERVATVFKALTDQMRALKRRFILMPPLTEDQYRAFDLKPHDKIKTETKVPTAEIRVKFFYLGQHQIGVIIEYASGDPNDPANKQFQVFYRILEHGEEVPTEPSTKWESFITQRMRNELDLPYDASGKRVIFSGRVINGRKVGPLGPLNIIIIP